MALIGREPARADRGYVTCATARTGSTYFGQLLSSTNALGRPREYFNSPLRQRRDPTYPLDPRQQLRIVVSKGATRNGIYAVKLLAGQLDDICKVIDPFHDLPNLKLLRLSRSDLLGQAISFARALQTHRWTGHATEVRPPMYSQQQLRRCLTTLIDQQSAWDPIIERLGREPLSLEYEAIMRDPQHAIDRVALFMGLSLPVPINHRRVSTSILRDEISIQWRQRFLDETGDEFRHLAGPTAA